MCGQKIETATAVMKDGTTLSGDLIIAADGERVGPPHDISKIAEVLTHTPQQSLVKESFKYGQLLRQARFKIFRAIIPTERLSNDERGKAMMAMTNKKFAIFLSSDRTLSWFSGRDDLLQDLEAGYVLRKGEDPRAGKRHLASDHIRTEADKCRNRSSDSLREDDGTVWRLSP